MAPFGTGVDTHTGTRPFHTIHSTSDRLLQELESKECRRFADYERETVGASVVNKVATAASFLCGLFPGTFLERIPALPTMPYEQHPHREKEPSPYLSPCTLLAMIRKLLSREDMRKDRKALEAVGDEGQGVRSRGVWDDASVMDKVERLATAQREGKTIHIADVMPIASIKHWEPPAKPKHKGRLVLRGTR